MGMNARQIKQTEQNEVSMMQRPEQDEYGCTARMVFVSSTRDQSASMSWKADHGIFFSTQSSRRIVVMGLYNLSADAVNSLIA
jgi:hypothetical protein